MNLGTLDVMTAMNDQDPPHVAELALHRTMQQVEEYVRREPTKAMAVALGVGVLLKILPPRLVASAVSNVAARVVPPTLLALGVLKAFEICSAKADPRASESQ